MGAPQLIGLNLNYTMKKLPNQMICIPSNKVFPFTLKLNQTSMQYNLAPSGSVNTCTHRPYKLQTNVNNGMVKKNYHRF